MTIPAHAQALNDSLPSDRDKSVANQLRTVIAAQAAGEAKLRVLDEKAKATEITLTPGLSKLLMELLRHVGHGDAVTLVPVGQMLTTQQAADVLNVSRPFLIGLLDKGEIQHSLVGRHRRIRAEHLFAYKRKRNEKRSKALSELAEIDAEFM